MLTFGSLFAGIGGFDLGFERAGLRCSWQVEINEFCRRVLAKHWPDVRRHDDVRTFPPGDPEEWRVDVVCGGFPCQDVSTAGRRAGMGAGTRSGLWAEFARVVALLRPRFVVVENTPGLLAPVREGGRLKEPAPLGRVLGELSALGYDAEWETVPAAAAGAPHIRDRVFVVAYPAVHRGGQRVLSAGPRPEGARAADPPGQGPGLAPHAGGLGLRDGGDGPGPQAAEAAAGPAERRTLFRPDPDRQGLAVRVGEQGDAGEEQPPPERGGGGGLAGAGWWGAEPAVVRVVHGVPRRLVRPAISGLGNAVVPQLAEWIGRNLIEAGK